MIVNYRLITLIIMPAQLQKYDKADDVHRKMDASCQQRCQCFSCVDSARNQIGIWAFAELYALLLALQVEFVLLESGLDWVFVDAGNEDGVSSGRGFGLYVDWMPAIGDIFQLPLVVLLESRILCHSSRYLFPNFLRVNHVGRTESSPGLVGVLIRIDGEHVELSLPCGVRANLGETTGAFVLFEAVHPVGDVLIGGREGGKRGKTC